MNSVQYFFVMVVTGYGTLGLIVGIFIIPAKLDFKRTFVEFIVTVCAAVFLWPMILGLV